MDLYRDTSLDISKLLTRRYSSSFAASSRLFDKSIRPHIYSIYGLVRIADEIVDSYGGNDQRSLLDNLEMEVYDSIDRGYSTNPLVHSFANTAKQYGINKDIIEPFFNSMRTDIDPPKVFSATEYQRYIIGSAEVVGLMCLRVFTDGNDATYNQLAKGASHLGAAYQKVNFLRDFGDDYRRLSRVYFPGLKYDSFDDKAKQAIEHDIEQDFSLARQAIMQLPKSSKRAVYASYKIYYKLFEKLKATPADTIKDKRIRVSTTQKVGLLVCGLIEASL